MMRIGQSTDIHRLAEGRKLVLGGVEIPYEKGLVGHSDADALTHALAEAILGALALGDLGKWFPDTDPKWEGVNSQIILKEVARMMKEKGYHMGNADCLVLIEKPKMAPHIQKMRDARRRTRLRGQRRRGLCAGGGAAGRGSACLRRQMKSRC